MPNTPNASFIPKQGPARRTTQIVSRQVHLFTVASYIIFTATLIATAGCFFYQKHTEKSLNNEISKLNNLIGGFNEADMYAVREFNNRLKQAQARLEKSASISKLFDTLEASTARSASVIDLLVKREGDSRVTMSAQIQTDSFDSSLFQRGVMERDELAKAVTVKEVNYSGPTSGEGFQGVSFVAEIDVPLSDIPYEVLPSTTVPEAVTPEVGLPTDQASTSSTTNPQTP